MKFFSIFSLVFLVCIGCSGGGSDYFFDSPAAFTTISGTVCKSGKTSYMVFVVDNTEDYGARIKKISGCEKKIDKSLKDKRDKKKGVYVGGTGVSIAHIISDGAAITATASTGQVKADHWKDDSDKSSRLPDHKGRIVFRRFTNDVEHDKSYNRSLPLAFYPEIIKSFKDEGFFFSGSDFVSYYIGFTDPEGNGETAEIDFPVSEIAVVGENIYLFDEFSGTLYKADKKLSVEEVKTFDAYKEGRMVGIKGGRFAFFKDNKLEIFDSEFNSIHTLETPEGFDISGVMAAKYGNGYKYRKLDRERVFEKVKVFGKNDTEEEKDTLSEANISLSKSWEKSDAEEGDIVWVGMKNGYVRAYDFATSSWLVELFDSSASSTYELEMRPYLSAMKVSYPKNSDTDADNVPSVETIEVMRGLPSPVTYKFVYEGMFDEKFEKGKYTVTRETFGKEVFAGNAAELGSGDSGGNTFSFEDDFISVAIRRTADDFATEKETSFYLSFRQAIPFVGFVSADMITDMENPAALTFLGFSALTRRFVEYDMYDDTVEAVYK